MLRSEAGTSLVVVSMDSFRDTSVTHHGVQAFSSQNLEKTLLNQKSNSMNVYCYQSGASVGMVVIKKNC